MVFFIELFQTVRLSKWYLHFDTPSNFKLLVSDKTFLELSVLVKIGLNL